MRPVALQVGELARRTRLSVRTLHYYDEIGLLSPSGRTEAGYRLYTAADVARLQQIKSLRQLGFSLEQIRDCLERPDFAPQRVLESHLARLREQLEIQQRLCRRLEGLVTRFRSAGEVSVEEFLQTIAEMTMIEKYYTPEQLAELEERRQQIGDERLQQAPADWAELGTLARAEMDKGTDPTDARVQTLARRRRELVEAFTGGNPEIEKSLRTMYEQEPVIHGMETAPWREVAEYLSKAWAARKSG